MLRKDAPLGVRLVVATIGFTLVLAAALTIPSALGLATWLRLAFTYVLIAAGFGLFSTVLPPTASRLRLQIVVGLAMIAAATVLLQMAATVGVAARATGSEASLLLTAVLAAIVLASARFAARPFLLAAIVGLGIKGAAALVGAFLMMPAGPLSAGAQVPIVWNGLWIVGSIYAVWLGRPKTVALPTPSTRAA